jgi:hypothetical protein
MRSHHWDSSYDKPLTVMMMMIVLELDPLGPLPFSLVRILMAAQCLGVREFPVTVLALK